MADEYARGEMDISDHKATYSGVMGVSTTLSLFTGLIVLYLSLVFAANVDWFSSLIVSVIVGGLCGYFLKRGAAYWANLIALAVITVISGFFVGLLAG